MSSASSSASPPPLFDRKLLLQRRSRPAFTPGAPDFLLERAREEIVFRLDAMPAHGAGAQHFPVAVDLGAYDGGLAETLRQRPYSGLVIATESSPLLLAKLNAPKLLCDEELLPLRDRSADLVVSALALHLVNDLPGALIQIRRALRPGGVFLAAVLGGATLTELREALMQAELDTLGGVSPRVPPMADVRDYGGLLQRAGFAWPVADADRFTVTYPSAMALMREARAIGGGNVLHSRRRAPLPRATLQRAVDIYTERFAADSGRVSASFEIICMTGQAPAQDNHMRHYVSHLQQE